MQLNDLVLELMERKNSEDIHKAELPKFLFRVVDFMELRTEWVGTATELLTEMKEREVTPNMVTKYLGQFAYEVLEPPGSLYKEIHITTVIAVTSRRKGVNKCAVKINCTLSKIKTLHHVPVVLI